MNNRKNNDLGFFESLAHVWRCYPHGGHWGAFLHIGNDTYIWDGHQRNWLLDTWATTDSYQLLHQTGDLDLMGDLRVGGRVHMQQRAVFKHDVVVEGRLACRHLRGHDQGFFDTSSRLREAVPSPHVGDWALVGATATPQLWQCYMHGRWEQAGTIPLMNAFSLDGYNAARDIVNDAVAQGYVFAGVAEPTTQPHRPDDYRVFYLTSQPGCYVHFDNIEVSFCSVLFWNPPCQGQRGYWTAKVILGHDLVDYVDEKTTALRGALDALNSSVVHTISVNGGAKKHPDVSGNVNIVVGGGGGGSADETLAAQVSQNTTDISELKDAVYGPNGDDGLDDAVRDLLDTVNGTPDNEGLLDRVGNLEGDVKPVDDHLDTESANPVENRVVANAIEELGGAVGGLGSDVESLSHDLEDLGGRVGDLEEQGGGAPTPGKGVRINDDHDFTKFDWRTGNPGLFTFTKDVKDITVDDVRDAITIPWDKSYGTPLPQGLQHTTTYHTVDEIPVGSAYKGIPHLWDDAELCSYKCTVYETVNSETGALEDAVANCHMRPVSESNSVDTAYKNAQVLKSFFAAMSSGEITDCVGFRLRNRYVVRPRQARKSGNVWSWYTYPSAVYSIKSAKSFYINIPTDFIIIGVTSVETNLSTGEEEEKTGGFTIRDCLFYTEHSLYMRNVHISKTNSGTYYTLYIYTISPKGNWSGDETSAELVQTDLVHTQGIEQLQLLDCRFTCSDTGTVANGKVLYKGSHVFVNSQNCCPFDVDVIHDGGGRTLLETNSIDHLYVSGCLFEGCHALDFRDVRFVKSCRIVGNTFTDFSRVPLYMGCTNSTQDEETQVGKWRNRVPGWKDVTHFLQTIGYMSCPKHIVGNTFSGMEKVVKPFGLFNGRSQTLFTRKEKYNTSAGAYAVTDNPMVHFDAATGFHDKFVKGTDYYFCSVLCECGVVYMLHNSISNIIGGESGLCYDTYSLSGGGSRQNVVKSVTHVLTRKYTGDTLDEEVTTKVPYVRVDAVYDAYLSCAQVYYVNNKVKNVVRFSDSIESCGIMKAKNSELVIWGGKYTSDGADKELILNPYMPVIRCFEHNEYVVNARELRAIWEEWLLACSSTLSGLTADDYDSSSQVSDASMDVDPRWVSARGEGESTSCDYDDNGVPRVILGTKITVPETYDADDPSHVARRKYAGWYTCLDDYAHDASHDITEHGLSVIFTQTNDDDRSDSGSSSAYSELEYGHPVAEEVSFSHNRVDAGGGKIVGYSLPTAWPARRFKVVGNVFKSSVLTSDQWYSGCDGNASSSHYLFCCHLYKLTDPAKSATPQRSGMLVADNIFYIDSQAMGMVDGDGHAFNLVTNPYASTGLSIHLVGNKYNSSDAQGNTSPYGDEPVVRDNQFGSNYTDTSTFKVSTVNLNNSGWSMSTKTASNVEELSFGG